MLKLSLNPFIIVSEVDSSILESEYVHCPISTAVNRRYSVK